MPKPLLVICSSSESEDIALALQENLASSFDALPWSQILTPLSSQILEGLEGELAKADFAAFIFAPDDDLALRGEEMKAVRDNVLLELGIARALLGRERAFIVRPSDASVPLRTATDLAGVVAATYDASDLAEDAKRALISASTSIRGTAAKLGAKPPPARPEQADRPRRVDGVLDRGSTESLHDLADAAIYVADKRNEYFENLLSFVTAGRNVVPSKYLYWTPQGSAHWLEFCELERYRFYSDSLAVLERHAGTVARKIIEVTKTAQVDFVSVGSGNGVKDNLILSHLNESLNPDEYIYYYPVDISDMLIVEAVRNALSKGLPKQHFKVKALIADFAKLERLQAFYEDRPCPNVFSVLGNTVGNADETNLMKAIDEAMLPGDWVLMEVNAGKADVKDPIWGERVTREHDFTPLTVFNVPFDPDAMEYSPVGNVSAIGGTKSILASYKEAEVDSKAVKNIKLSIVHYYDYLKFRAYMEKKLHVKVHWSMPKPEKGVYLVLGRRERGGGGA